MARCQMWGPTRRNALALSKTALGLYQMSEARFLFPFVQLGVVASFRLIGAQEVSRGASGSESLCKVP